MAITGPQIAAAEAVQHAAAHDASPRVRLVAGPGTGKSCSIEERVCWLLGQGIPEDAICAVSFTRASALELRIRVHRYCQNHGHANAENVRITTLHSLALRLLRAAGQLGAYPADPLVLDGWEQENIFDEEFGSIYSVSRRRREEIRRHQEAFWSTGVWGPPNYIPPIPPISPAEQANFTAFHGPRTQAYSCVLPGEIIRQCVRLMRANLLNAVNLINLQHLVVDEFQDLNPLDLSFVNHIAQQGASLFFAGDDDQSIYSFRFADPSGIQNFHLIYPGASLHYLYDCFRCTTSVLAASTTLIGAHPAPNRIAKHQVSLYDASAPPVPGTAHLWNHLNSNQEAQAIAESCRALIAAGMGPREILILVSNKRLGQPTVDALAALEIPHEHPREEGFLDSDAGRLILALLRIVCEPNDYISHRVILGLPRGIGLRTCISICDKAIQNNQNFRNLFYLALPGGIFAGREITALNQARTVCGTVSAWQHTDLLHVRAADLDQIVQTSFTAAELADWQAYRQTVPGDITLEELRDYLWADTDEQQTAMLEAVYTRLGIPIPGAGVLPPRVRVMTMHGAKGLSARAVFIPGLEEQVFPGPRRAPFAGLVLEAARLLYVSITRARATCVISYASRRMMNGTWTNHTPSRFCLSLNGAFAGRANGLTAAEVAQIVSHCGNLF
jgi:DNA helicase II / ATP-dependent DNA helicase PcrA